MVLFLYRFSIFYLYFSSLQIHYDLIMDVRKIVIDYIKTLDKKDKERLRVMLSHGIVCGAGFANERGIDVAFFNSELKSVLEENK